MSVVEDKRMSEWFSLNIEGFVFDHFEFLLIEGVGLEEVVFDGLFEVGLFLDEDGLGAECLLHGAEFLGCVLFH